MFARQYSSDMEMSPGGRECSPGSAGSTPHRREVKRERDEENADTNSSLETARQHSKKMEMTPCHTPIQSPNTYGAARMCLATPLCSTPLSGYPLLQRSELGLRWGSAYSPGPRRWPPCLVPSPVPSPSRNPACVRLETACLKLTPPLPMSPSARKRIGTSARLTRAAVPRMHTLASSMVMVATQSRYSRCAPAPHAMPKALTAALAVWQEHCAEHLHDNIVSSSHFPAMEFALKDGFLRTDADFLQQALSTKLNKDRLVGSAAVVMMATCQQLILAHAGDCRAVLVRREGAAIPFEVLTYDHSAEESAPGSADLLRPDEARRISEAGAQVAHGFANVGDSTLPMTRALGNMNLKVAHGRDWRCVNIAARTKGALPIHRGLTFTRALPVSQEHVCTAAGRDSVARGEHPSAQRGRSVHCAGVRWFVRQLYGSTDELGASSRHREKYALRVPRHGRRREQGGPPLGRLRH